MHAQFTLCLADVEMLLACSNDDRVLECARAWLTAYQLACSFEFAPEVCRRQAGAAWDRVAEEVAELMCPDTPLMN